MFTISEVQANIQHAHYQQACPVAPSMKPALWLSVCLRQRHMYICIHIIVHTHTHTHTHNHNSRAIFEAPPRHAIQFRSPMLQVPLHTRIRQGPFRRPFERIPHRQRTASTQTVPCHQPLCLTHLHAPVLPGPTIAVPVKLCAIAIPFLRTFARQCTQGTPVAKCGANTTPSNQPSCQHGPLRH